VKVIRAANIRLHLAPPIRLRIDVLYLPFREISACKRQPSRTNGPFAARAHAEREQNVGLPCRVVGLIGSVAGDEAERQRMRCVDAAEAARRGRESISLLAGLVDQPLDLIDCDGLTSLGRSMTC
jgi:hypothetical protein